MSRVNLAEAKSMMDDGVMGWEDMYGVDCPGYLPYWVAYMPYHDRVEYLQIMGHTFNDYVPEMLKTDFKWSEHNTIYSLSQLDDVV